MVINSVCDSLQLQDIPQPNGMTVTRCAQDREQVREHTTPTSSDEPNYTQKNGEVRGGLPPENWKENSQRSVKENM